MRTDLLEVKSVFGFRFRLQNLKSLLPVLQSDTSLGASLRASSPIWASEASLARTRERARGLAARSRVLARLVSLAQIGELARRLVGSLFLLLFHVLVSGHNWLYSIHMFRPNQRNYWDLTSKSVSFICSRDFKKLCAVYKFLFWLSCYALIS